MRDNLLKTLGVLATIGIFIVIIAGVIVTKTGSGDGCGPNWPLCHGKLFPDEPTFETVVEYTHRLVTGIVGLIVILFSILSALIYRRNKEVVAVAIAALFFLILQSALGALAVTHGQSSAVMALHFGFSLLSYATVFVLAYFVFQLANQGKLPTAHFSAKIRFGVVGFFIASYIVVYLGALVTHTGSQGGCLGWPLCNGALIPAEWATTTTINYIHRITSLFYLIASAVLYIWVKQSHKTNRLLYSMTALITLLVFAQVLSGGLLIFSNFNLYANIFHGSFITLMYGYLLYIFLYVFRRPASS